MSTVNKVVAISVSKPGSTEVAYGFGIATTQEVVSEVGGEILFHSDQVSIKDKNARRKIFNNLQKGDVIHGYLKRKNKGYRLENIFMVVRDGEEIFSSLGMV
jgi:hypothetical protein